MPSALNRSGTNIYKGMAVSIANDLAVPTKAPAVCSALAADGAPSPGVITTITSGILELLDWSLIVHSQSLLVGAVYTVTGNGLLMANGPGQAVGVAVSKTQLSVHIDVTQAQQSFTTIVQPSTSTFPNFIVLPMAPFAAIGKPGDFFIDSSQAKMYGPKTSVNLWPPTPILYS